MAWRGSRFPLDVDKVADPEIRAMLMETRALAKAAEALRDQTNVTWKKLAEVMKEPGEGAA